MFVILNKFCVIICKHYLDRYSKVATDVNKALHVRDKWCVNPFIVKSGTTITTVILSNDKFTIQRCLLQSFFCSEGETFISQLTYTQNRDRNHCSSFIFLLAGVCCTSRAVSVCVVFLVKRSWEWPGALSPLTADQLTQHKARYCFLDDDGGECLNFQSQGGGSPPNTDKQKKIGTWWWWGGGVGCVCGCVGGGGGGVTVRGCDWI